MPKYDGMKRGEGSGDSGEQRREVGLANNQLGLSWGTYVAVSTSRRRPWG